MDRGKLESIQSALDARQDDIRQKWLTFWLQGQMFGVSIAHVEQIISMQSNITAVPEYPSYAKGVINLRGSIIPVVDLRVRLGKPETAYTDRTCIIVTSVGDEQIGLIVDEVDAVIGIPSEVVSPPPKMGEDGVNRYLTGIARVTGEDGKEQVVLCLDATKVLRAQEFETLSKGRSQ